MKTLEEKIIELGILTLARQHMKGIQDNMTFLSEAFDGRRHADVIFNGTQQQLDILKELYMLSKKEPIK